MEVMSDTESQSDRPSVSLSTIAAVLSTAGAVAGLWVLFYALGLVLLALQLRLTYGHDFVTAWSTATLVSRSIVLGELPRLFVERPAFFLYLGTWAVLDWFFTRLARPPTERSTVDVEREMKAEFDEAQKQIAAASTNETEALRRYGAWIDWQKHQVGRWRRRRQREVRWRPKRNVLIDLLLLVFVALPPVLAGRWLVAADAVVTLASAMVAMTFMIKQRFRLPTILRLLGASALLYVGLTAGGLISGSLRTPPLPVVELRQAELPKGYLLNHADGYWYILTSKGKVEMISDDAAQWLTLPPRAAPSPELSPTAPSTLSPKPRPTTVPAQPVSTPTAPRR